MAEWAASGSKKSCEECRKIWEKVPRKVRNKVKEQQDCAKCPVITHQPISSNEIIVELYNCLPQIYGDWSGYRIVTASDIKAVLEIFEIPKRLWEDYYQRLLFFVTTVIAYQAKKREAEERRKNKGAGSAKRGPSRGRITGYKK